MFNGDELVRAEQVVYQHMLPTPAYAWPLLSRELGFETWVKHENHTPIGAFKARGGLVYLDELTRAGDDRLLVTATRGNHGQSIPYAARQYGREVHVFIPEGNSVEKNAAMRAWGAQLHVEGKDFDAAREAAEQYAQSQGAHMVPSFHQWLVRGVATYAKELFDTAGQLDRVYVPIGMGSGAAGVIGVRDLAGAATEIVGVVSDAADAMALSLEAGRIVQTNSAATFADGVATRVPVQRAFDVLSEGLARIVRVSDDQVAQAMRLLYRTTHNVAEGAGAIATAAAALEADVNRGERIGVVLTGGNVDADVFARVLAGETPQVPA